MRVVCIQTKVEYKLDHAIYSMHMELHFFFFHIYGSMHHKYIPIYIQQDATLHSLFISGNCPTYFG